MATSTAVALGSQTGAATAKETSVGLPARRESEGRRARDDEGGRIRVARFAETGGVDLTGRVVNADSGRPMPGISVEARWEGRFVEDETDEDGTFNMPGMLPGSKVLVWLGGRRDRTVAERFDVRIPNNGKSAHLGTVSLLDGNEMDPHLNGWIGIYVARKDDKLRVSGVNAWVPADSAGIEVGDVLLAVNGRETKGLGPRTAAFLLRGPSGSLVSLDVESSSGKRRHVTLRRVLH